MPQLDTCVSERHRPLEARPHDAASLLRAAVPRDAGTGKAVIEGGQRGSPAKLLTPAVRVVVLPRAGRGANAGLPSRRNPQQIP